MNLFFKRLNPLQPPRIPYNRYLMIAAIVASVLSLIEILDFFELPFESVLNLGSAMHFLPGLVSSLLVAGYVGLFALMVLESLSLPIPSEVFLPMAGYLAFTGKLSFGLALAVSTVGGLIGSLIIFYLALVLGSPVVYSLATKLGVSSGSLAKSEKWLSGRGSVAVLVARFIPGIRSSISIPAGALKMNPWRFSIVTLLGSLGWSFLLMYIGYSIGPASKLSSPISMNLLGQLSTYLIASSSILYIIYFLYKRINTDGRSPSSKIEPLK